MEANESLIKSYDPYAVVVATGAHAIKPEGIRGIERSNVCTITDILEEKIAISNKSVAVIGSGMSGLEIAEKLAEEGNRVIIVEMDKILSPNTHIQHVDDILPRLKQYNTQFFLGHRLEEIKEDQIVLTEVKTGKSKCIKVNHVVVSLGVAPEDQLYKELENVIEHLYIIGDAGRCGRIAQATHSAAYTALNL